MKRTETLSQSEKTLKHMSLSYQTARGDVITFRTGQMSELGYAVRNRVFIGMPLAVFFFVCLFVFWAIFLL